MDSIDPEITPIISAAHTVGMDGIVTFSAVRIYDIDALMP